MNELKALLKEYEKAPEIFQAGRYWKAYEDKIIKEIEKADLQNLRSGSYPVFGTFGFGEAVYFYPTEMPFYKKIIFKTIRKLFITNKHKLPYSIGLSDIREMAYNHCILLGELANIKPIYEIETSTFGNPQDLFEINGKKYTMSFLTYYIRLCFFQRHAALKGNETIVELGTGSGHQVEILKKVFPDLTILCFDLPYNLYLCHEYLKNVFDEKIVTKPSKGLEVTDLNNIEKGKIHMFGNWQFPLLKEYKFDVFWNAASFGEMEPNIVQNYLSYVLNNCNSIYLLQARYGKESTKDNGVKIPIKFEDYNAMLSNYELVKESDAYQAHRKLSDSKGYFHAVWKNKA